MANQYNNYENKLWKEIASGSLSVSHDHWHVDRVLLFANQLQAIHGGDPDVITTAVILHDLGRSDPNLHGQESINSSLEKAREILEHVNFPKEKVELVLQAINEHDKPEVKPGTIEGRILKDADFLAGFGAWGVLRVAMWAGETGGGVAQINDRLKNRMAKRLDKLEFPESERWAIRDVEFVNLFRSQMDQAPRLEDLRKHGKYIVLEGISGSGKDTLAVWLQEEISKMGREVVTVSEPAKDYEQLSSSWSASHHKKLDNPMINKFLFMADRYQQINEVVIPALESGKIVISNRSFLSTLVYQCAEDNEMFETAFFHRFVPTPDLILLYDLEPEQAFIRIQDRETKGAFEKKELMLMHRKKYLSLYESGIFGSRIRMIDTSQSLETVKRLSFDLVSKIL